MAWALAAVAGVAALALGAASFTEALGMPFEQSRHAVIARVRGALPLGDSCVGAQA